MSDWRSRVGSLLRLLSSLALLVLILALFHPALSHLSGGRLSALAPWLDPGSAAPGFVVSATSSPSGGRLFVDGEDRGPTPTVSNVRCRDGQSVTLRVLKDGFRPWERAVHCREGGSLLIRATLER